MTTVLLLKLTTFALATQPGIAKQHIRQGRTSLTTTDYNEDTAPAPVIQISDIEMCSESFWEHPAPPGDAEVLPLEIPLDRIFDVQWNPPGFPTLSAEWLQPPFGDSWRGTDAWEGTGKDRDGHYSFVRYHQDGTMGLVRERADGSMCSVFREVAFIAVSDEVLMMNGDPPPGGDAYGGYAGGGFGTLVKGMSIPAGDEDGEWDTTTLEESEVTAVEWLLQNFEVTTQLETE